nr:uncharacterized protein LOC109159918 [Ipomoea batatas]
MTKHADEARQSKGREPMMLQILGSHQLIATVCGQNMASIWKMMIAKANRSFSFETSLLGRGEPDVTRRITWDYFLITKLSRVVAPKSEHFVLKLSRSRHTCSLVREGALQPREAKALAVREALSWLKTNHLDGVIVKTNAEVLITNLNMPNLSPILSVWF